MRRCYRSVALVLGGVLVASNTFSNSCSLNLLETYAADNTLAEEETASNFHEEAADKARLRQEAFQAEILKEPPLEENSLEKEALEEEPSNEEPFPESQPEEENVETEILTEETEPQPPEAEEEEENTAEQLAYQDYEVLLKIVEAEAGSEDLTGKILVVNVILNRVESELFPDTVTEVVYQKHKGRAQFSPTADGRINTVSVSEETKEAARRGLNGEDYSNGALYFRSAHCNSTWFDRSLTRVMEHGNHIFYTN